MEGGSCIFIAVEIYIRRAINKIIVVRGGDEEEEEEVAEENSCGLFIIT